MNEYKILQEYLLCHQFKWLVTGVAGFIGSNLLEMLLNLKQKVIGIDNFVTGYKHNISEVLQKVPPQCRDNFVFYEGDICSLDDCKKVMEGVDYVLHQAALGSVPRSIKDPITTNKINIDGFLNILLVAKDCKIKRLVYASSSSVYGDSESLPKQEQNIGKQLSPYAVTKYVNELYASTFSHCYEIETIGLRYFNVFGKRQDPNGQYAAVIPLWFAAMIKGGGIVINGDGETSRDFCYIQNVVQANILAALVDKKNAINQVYNVACGRRVSLNELCDIMGKVNDFPQVVVKYSDFRAGDIRHSLADISKAQTLLGYDPTYDVKLGMQESKEWYLMFFNKK